MRYRRLSYRYAVVMATGRSRSFGETWQRQPGGISMGQPAWRPPTDVVETATEVIVLVELAGVDHEQLDVLLFEDAVIVEGERRLPSHAAGVYHAAEIRQGQVRLELPLPAAIDPAQVDAHYERGLLEMRLGKRLAPVRSASIPIERAMEGSGVHRRNTTAEGPAERDDDGA
jgi:HSP20 family protein